MTSKPSKIILGDWVIGNRPSVCEGDNKKNTQQKNTRKKKESPEQ